jgi:alpha,alpha-trehalase
MAGTIDLVHRCYTGVVLRADVLHFNPQLPRALKKLRLSLRYRRQLLDIEVSEDFLSIQSRPFPAPSITVAYRGHHRELAPGGRCRFRLLTTKERSREDPSAPDS